MILYLFVISERLYDMKKTGIFILAIVLVLSFILSGCTAETEVKEEQKDIKTAEAEKPKEKEVYTPDERPIYDLNTNKGQILSATQDFLDLWNSGKSTYEIMDLATKAELTKEEWDETTEFSISMIPGKVYINGDPVYMNIEHTVAYVPIASKSEEGVITSQSENYLYYEDGEWKNSMLWGIEMYVAEDPVED